MLAATLVSKWKPYLVIETQHIIVITESNTILPQLI